MARLPYPRAAVSCILQSTQRRYLLIKRGKPPGVGEWSVPGGKLELGETSIAGALREIYEETGLPACALSMHPRPVTVSDVCTHDASGSLEYHYVIAQCFAWVAPEYEAQIIPGDDASDARWFAAEEIRAMPDEATSGGPQEIIGLIELARSMHQAGLLVPPPRPHVASVTSSSIGPAAPGTGPPWPALHHSKLEAA